MESTAKSIGGICLTAKLQTKVPANEAGLRGARRDAPTRKNRTPCRKHRLPALSMEAGVPYGFAIDSLRPEPTITKSWRAEYKRLTPW